MRILKLKAENVFNLEAIEIEPDGNEIILTGENGAGKSSILDAILIALTNEKFEQPIRRGAKSARISLNLGDILVRRQITKKGSYLEIIAADGTKVKSPQKLLDSIIGELTLDPTNFYRLKDKAQRNQLAAVAGLDLSELKLKYCDFYDDRKLANKLVSEKQARLAVLPAPPPETPTKEIDCRALQIEIDNLNRCERAWKIDSGILAQIEIEVSDLRKLIETKLAWRDAFKKKMPQEFGAGNRELLDQKTTELDDSFGINKLVLQREVRGQAMLDLQALKDNVDGLQADMDSNLEEQEKRINEAEFPLPELSITEDAVLYNGIPLSQASTAERIAVSTRLAMAMNPKLKIIMIREGALIGSKIWDAITAVARAEDYQVWVEQFQEKPGAVGIHIHEGKVVKS